ncbi:zinc-binding dehydrogenase [Klebsiella oxytoca]
MEQLPEDMKAVVCHGPQDYRFEKIRRPIAKEREVVIKVDGCGICAGDCKAQDGAPMFWGDNPWVKTPVVPGHEFYGRVAELGPGSAEKYKLKIGDRILAEQIVPCHECRFCNTGKYWMCETHDIYGFQKDVADGGMAEYMRFSERAIIHKIPESLSEEDAALIEPMACAIHTVRRGDIDLDDVVVIAGAGPLGLCMVQVAHLKTPKKLVVIDTMEDRLALAKAFGADVVINAVKEDAVAIVKSMTDGYGCDVYIEATGAPVGVTQGLEMIRKLGRFVEFSVFGKETTADWSIIGDRKELDIRGAHLGPYSYEIAIDLFERGLLTAKGVVTHFYSIDEWKAAFEMAKSLDSIKVVIKP